MFKLLVLSCLLVSCLADPFGLPSWLRTESRQHHHPQGCANLAEGWRACAQLDNGEALVPHGRDCSLFFYCNGNARPTCRKCPASLHFNPRLQVCDWPENVNCAPRPHHNGTTSHPTTPDDNATVTVIDDSTTTKAPPTYSTEPTTTEAPTTEAPTTEAPTTEAPTTEAPTTEAPTTEAPTTEAPTTEAPTTEAPTTEAPTTEAPTTEAPTTEAPTTEAPPTYSTEPTTTDTETSVVSWPTDVPWGRK